MVCTKPISKTCIDIFVIFFYGFEFGCFAMNFTILKICKKKNKWCLFCQILVLNSLYCPLNDDFQNCVVYYNFHKIVSIFWEQQAVGEQKTFIFKGFLTTFSIFVLFDTFNRVAARSDFFTTIRLLPKINIYTFCLSIKLHFKPCTRTYVGCSPRVGGIVYIFTKTHN